MNKYLRPTKDEYYLKLAEGVAARATCLRRRYGVIIVKNDAIISTGYCGAPRGIEDCLTRGICLREELNVPSGEKYELCVSVHAELNAIINAARTGANISDGRMYLVGVEVNTGKITEYNEPCMLCKRAIINAGISELIVKSKNNIIKINPSKWGLNNIFNSIKKE